MTNASSNSLPKVGQTRCYWALLSPALHFLYLDPVLSYHLEEQSPLLIGKSLLEFIHPEEMESSRKDLGNALENRQMQGSVTRVRFARLSRVRRILGHTGAPYPWPSADKIAIDENYMVVDIVLNWAADGATPSNDNLKAPPASNLDGLVLCFIHAHVDLNPPLDNDERVKSEWTNWCGTPKFDGEDIKEMGDRLSRAFAAAPPTTDRQPYPGRVLQIIANDSKRGLLFSWPPVCTRTLPSGFVSSPLYPASSLAGVLAGIAHTTDMSGANEQGAKTSCMRRYKSLHSICLPPCGRSPDVGDVRKKESDMSNGGSSGAGGEGEMEGAEVKVESIFIPHASIIFACHHLNSFNRRTISNNSSPVTFSATTTAPIQPHPASYHNLPPGSDPRQLQNHPNLMSTAIASAPPITQQSSPPSPNFSTSYSPYDHQSPTNYGPNNMASHHHHSNTTSTTTSSAPHPYAYMPPPAGPNTAPYPSASPHQPPPRSYDYNSQTHQWQNGGARSGYWGGPNDYQPPPGTSDEYYPSGRGDYGASARSEAPQLPPGTSSSDMPPPSIGGGAGSGEASGGSLEVEMDVASLVPPPRRREYGNSNNDNASSGSSTGTSRGRNHANRPAGVMKCTSCKATTSPEWRKGPSGRKELCNACGLRYARSRAKKEGTSSSRSKNQDASSNSTGSQNGTGRKKKQARRNSSPSSSYSGSGSYTQPTPGMYAPGPGPNSAYPAATYTSNPPPNYSGSAYSAAGGGGSTYSPVGSTYSAGSAGPTYPAGYSEGPAYGNSHQSGGSPSPTTGSKRGYSAYEAGSGGTGYDYEFERYDDTKRHQGSESPSPPLPSSAPPQYAHYPGGGGSRFPSSHPQYHHQLQNVKGTRYPSVPSPLSASYAGPPSPEHKDGESPRQPGESFERDSREREEVNIKRETADDEAREKADQHDTARDVVLPALAALGRR